MTRTGVTVVLALGFSSSWAAGQAIPFTPYLSQADSPLATLAGFTVEDFEDDAFVPGISASGGIINGPHSFADSVDGDDGAIDGFGRAGRSWYSAMTFTAITFTFDPTVLGGYPQYAGLVWTDVAIVASGSHGFAEVSLQAFGPGGPLGTVPPALLGDGLATGETAEDRFVGWHSTGGISAIRISVPASVDWEVDHVQYALVPAPSAAAFVLLSAASAVRRRRGR